MFGAIFGAACLAGSFFALRRARYHHYRAWRGGPGSGRSWRGAMRFVFERLETSPGQEKVLIQAAEDVSAAFEKMRGLWGDTRSAWAQSLRGEAFDAATLREQETRQEAHLEELRKTIHASLGKIHEALDPRQRRELADLIERGGYASHVRYGGFRGGRCGYRSAWAG